MFPDIKISHYVSQGEISQISFRRDFRNQPLIDLSVGTFSFSLCVQSINFLLIVGDRVIDAAVNELLNIA